MTITRCSRWALAALLVWPASAAAQFNEAPPPAAYALQGVTLVRADGTVSEGVNVIVRGARIEAIGADVQIPDDAKLLEGDSLFVYPGIIDAAGKVDYKFPEQEINLSEIGSWNPPRYVQSFMPHRLVVDHLTNSGADLAEQRKAGIVAAAVHADGRLMPGRGTLVMLRSDARAPSDLVLRPVIGLTMSFQGAQSVYPRRLFAVIAFYRQSFEDARHLAAHQAAYDRGRDGVSAPGWDPDLEVLQEVMKGETRVFFRADFARDIQRVLGLADEYGFRPIIVGGEEAWRVADELKAADVPVLVSLDFPKPERWEPEKEKEEEESKDEEPPEDGNGPNGSSGQEEELDAGALREKQRIEAIYANAGLLSDAGVQFALTSGGGKAKILEKTRKAIEYGLGEDAALAALTSAPASILGVERLARVERGGPATFIVSAGPLFGEESRLTYTFVEGRLEKADKKKAKGSGEPAAVDVSGKWEFTTESEIGQRTMQVSFRQDDEGELDGSLTGSLGETGIKHGSVSGSEISFSVVLTINENRMELEFTGTVEGDEMSGEGKTAFGGFTWTARRVSGPGEEMAR